MNEVPIRELQKAIRHNFGVESKHVGAVHVAETWDGAVAWEGDVQVFDLRDHPLALRCYAWSHETDKANTRNFVTVLHHGPIDSPKKAVQAVIANEARKHGH